MTQTAADSAKIEYETVDLDFFAGKQFTLTAVDESHRFPMLYGNGDANGLAFTLDGITYAAVEDESDGYRSSLDRVLVLPAGVMMSTEIPPHTLVGRAVDKGEYGHASDVIDLIDIRTGKTVLSFGTDNSDDYYPSFVGNFDPTALFVNQSTETR